MNNKQTTTGRMGIITHNQVYAWIFSARTQLGLPIIYGAALFETLPLIDVQLTEAEENDHKLRSTSLDDILESALAPLRMKGLQHDQLNTHLQGVSNKRRLIELLSEGQKSFMQPTFIPNGGRECSGGGSYRHMRPICNHAMAEVVEAGRAIIFTEDALKQHGYMSEIHINELTWAEKPGKVLGRTCINASKKSKNFPSINESINSVDHDAQYPEYPLPTLAHIYEMACQQQQQRYPGITLGGATVDVSSAYQQTPQSINSAKLFGVRVKIADEIRQWINIVVIFLVGMWGFTRAGHVYCICATAIDELTTASNTGAQLLT
jgi:hypothetical protein